MKTSEMFQTLEKINAMSDDQKHAGAFLATENKNVSITTKAEINVRCPGL